MKLFCATLAKILAFISPKTRMKGFFFQLLLLIVFKEFTLHVIIDKLTCNKITCGRDSVVVSAPDLQSGGTLFNSRQRQTALHARGSPSLSSSRGQHIRTSFD